MEYNLDGLGLELPPNSPQELFLSDNLATHFSMESNKQNTRKWQGLVHRSINYLVSLDILDETIQSTFLYPDRIHINYQSGTQEVIFMPQQQAGLLVSIISDQSISIEPKLAMRPHYLASSTIDDYDVLEEEILFIKGHSGLYLGIMADMSFSFASDPRLVSCEFHRDRIRNDGSSKEHLFIPGRLNYDASKIRLAVGIAQDKDELKRSLKSMLDNEQLLHQQTRDHLVDLLQKIPASTSNKELAWAIISLEKLKMNRFGKGTYAGLHWFDDYWGRDTFISLRGSALRMGDWDFARETIRAMASLQLNDASRYEHGRVPNRISVEGAEPDYHSADGLGWFVKSIADYLRLHPDPKFAQELYPHMLLALEGEQSRMDKLGFVTHRPRETWMDALTNGIVQTPRDDRAIEIQALLYQVYDSIIYVSEVLDVPCDLVGPRDSLLHNIKTYYWDGKTLADHLDPDGTRDGQLRPNQFIALSLLPSDFLSKDELDVLIKHSMPLITSHGIRTLDPKDSQYKPRHDGGGWHHDEAYHNGDIWPWLSGPAIEVLLGTGYEYLIDLLLQTLTSQVLDHDPAGGIGEVFDGSAASPQSVAAALQLWSMAEYLRVHCLLDEQGYF